MKKKHISLLLLAIIIIFILHYYYYYYIDTYTYKKTCKNKDTNIDIDRNIDIDIDRNKDIDIDLDPDPDPDLDQDLDLNQDKDIFQDLDIKKHGNDNYHLFEIDNVLSSEECDRLIKYSKYKTLSDSVVFNNNYNTVNDTRISKTAWFELNENDVVSKCSNIAKKMTKKNDNNLEKLQLVYYPVGGYFRPHHDATKNSTIVTDVSSREYTLLIYLNDVEEGGETVFPILNLEIKPKKGKGILFRTLDENDKIIPESLHGGNPVIKGEKWICNNWIHNKIIN
jgi:prolyl 4-hydroxylase